MTILILGGTGTLGRPTTELLRAAGRDVRVLSRHPAPDRIHGDLRSGEGMQQAFEGVETVAHLALGANREALFTQRVVDHAQRADVRHLFYISIVGAEKNPLPYYRQKVESERIIEQSGVPFSILRATQFHDLVAGIIRAQRALPVYFSVRGFPLQPIDAAEVAHRVVEVLDAGPSGRVDDIGGPEQRTLDDCIADWQRAHGTHKPVLHAPAIGRVIGAYRAGAQLATLPGYGTRTFAEYAEAAAAAAKQR